MIQHQYQGSNALGKCEIRMQEKQKKVGGPTMSTCKKRRKANCCSDRAQTIPVMAKLSLFKLFRYVSRLNGWGFVHKKARKIWLSAQFMSV